MSKRTESLDNRSYPQGLELQQAVARRQQVATLWRLVFLAATMVGIVALTALLFNVINSAFGYVAAQNEVDPQALVLDVEETTLLGLPNLTASEDDNVLAEGVAGSANAIGFFGYAYFQEHADQLKVLAVDGVVPSPAALNAGDYALARPLYIYTTPEILAEKPQVAALLAYYLQHVGSVIAEVGYFPAAQAEIDQSSAALAVVVVAPANPAQAEGAIAIAGSSTVYPLTQRIAADFRASGFAGDIRLESVGTKAGFVSFCSGEIDIANASRPINRTELAACTKAKRTPLAFRVGTDALAIVVSQANPFLADVTLEQLKVIFGGAQQWSAVDPAWPATPIERFVPGSESGTLDFFAEFVLAGPLANLSKAELIAILEANVSRGLMRRFENDQPFAERTQASVYKLVQDRVVNSVVVDTWSLADSLFRRGEIEATVATIPNGELQFRSWISGEFLTSAQSSTPDEAGVRGAVLGSLWVILITLFIALPIGVGAAIYLEEYAHDNWFNRLIATNINNLAGVPSIIYGMLGLAIFVRTLEPLTSGSLFGAADPTTANGRTILSAGFTLALLILPLIIINAQEAIRAVPRSLREAGYGLGATKWQVIWHHLLPVALPGILTGNILAMSRAIGETAPLVVVGASTFIAIDPSGPFSKFTTLPVQIYQWTSRPQDEFRNIAAAAIIVLLVLLLSLNAGAVLLRNRFSTTRA